MIHTSIILYIKYVIYYEYGFYKQNYVIICTLVMSIEVLNTCVLQIRTSVRYFCHLKEGKHINKLIYDNETIFKMIIYRTFFFLN